MTFVKKIHYHYHYRAQRKLKKRSSINLTIGILLGALSTNEAWGSICVFIWGVTWLHHDVWEPDLIGHCIEYAPPKRTISLPSSRAQILYCKKEQKSYTKTVTKEVTITSNSSNLCYSYWNSNYETKDTANNAIPQSISQPIRRNYKEEKTRNCTDRQYIIREEIWKM